MIMLAITIPFEKTWEGFWFGLGAVLAYYAVRGVISLLSRGKN